MVYLDFWRNKKMGRAGLRPRSLAVPRKRAIPVKRSPSYEGVKRSFDNIERQVDKYLQPGGVKTIRDTVVSVVTEYFRLVCCPLKPWVGDLKEIETVDRLGSKLIDLVKMYADRLAVVNAVLNGFRFVMNTFSSGRMTASDREWPFVKVLLRRIVGSITEENLLCALVKAFSTNLTEIMSRGSRSTAIDEVSAQYVAEMMGFLKSLWARIEQQRQQRINSIVASDDE
ncbi:hypothetical protein L596_018588 [Steinernema carpocapsae]|uniref:Uncharacterized protein n=2 Tax=Steinernema carpocapsae TaxID=34508 RepID=A0A4U5N5J8_STECR|nr:hypothetical protein L596_018588 [Steinernema carpocapsae]